MNASDNATTSDATHGMEYSNGCLHELVYITITLFISTLSGLIASFFWIASTSAFRVPVDMTLPLHHPFTAMVAGPTGCGKTRFVFKLIDNAARIIEPPPSKIVYCYGEYQQLFRNYPQVTFHQGLPKIENFDGSKPVLLIVDDLMHETDESIANLFTKGSHHRNISVIFLVQNLFYKNKYIRTISLNSHYMILFKNPRDASQFANLARQMYPKQSAFAVEAYKDATREPYSYLFVDLRTEQDEDLRLRTNIFPTETRYVYVPK